MKQEIYRPLDLVTYVYNSPRKSEAKYLNAIEKLNVRIEDKRRLEEQM